MIDTPGLPDEQRSLAYGMRALAYSLLGMFDKALVDYDAALKIKPDFPLALNNRAWAYYKLGRPADGVADVEKALRAVARQPLCARHPRPHPPVAGRRARRHSRTTSSPCAPAASGS